MLPIDLRSDTVTKPSASMRKAMAEADVGDDVYGDDPTVNRLQAMVAERLGKEAALFVTSGTMGNHLCFKVLTTPGDELVTDEDAHTFNNEVGAAAALSGVQVRTVRGERGLFTAAQLEAAIRPSRLWLPRSRVVVLENTHNFGGGTVWPLDAVAAVSATAKARGLSVHMDGARLWNAEVASGVSSAAYCAHVDTVSVCLSKGLGAPAGSVIAGPREVIELARRFRKMWGGGMRQAGILAAAGLYALERNVARLAEDHANARALAHGLADIEGLAADPKRVETNMVFVEVTRANLTAADLATRLHERGVLVNATAPRTLRLVTHLDVSAAMISDAVARMRELMTRSI